MNSDTAGPFKSDGSHTSIFNHYGTPPADSQGLRAATGLPATSSSQRRQGRPVELSDGGKSRASEVRLVGAMPGPELQDRMAPPAAQLHADQLLRPPRTALAGLEARGLGDRRAPSD